MKRGTLKIGTDLSISLRISSWDMPSFELPLITVKQTTLDYYTTTRRQFTKTILNYIHILMKSASGKIKSL